MKSLRGPTTAAAGMDRKVEKQACRHQCTTGVTYKLDKTQMSIVISAIRNGNA
jgi:hypothetical protein